MPVLQVTREAVTDQRYGLGKSVVQLIEGLAQLGVSSERLSAADLPHASWALAEERALGWAKALGEHRLGILQAISRVWQIGFDAAQIAAERGFTHVHCHDAVVAHGFASSPHAPGIAFGITQHGFDRIAFSLRRYIMPLDDVAYAALDRLESEVLQRLGWVVFMTHLGATRVAGQFGVAVPDHWHVVPHARPAWTLPSRDAARQALGWPDDEQVLLAVGQLIPLKRFEWVVRAMRGLEDRWRLVILGEGDCGPLLAAARDAGVAPPQVAATDTPQTWYAAADAFTSASAVEGFGMAHLEAMLAGLPMACTAVGGVPELVGDGGLLLPDDEAAYAAGLRGMLGDAHARQQLSRRATARACAWPDRRAIASRHLEIYERATRPHRLDVSPLEALF